MGTARPQPTDIFGVGAKLLHFIVVLISGMKMIARCCCIQQLNRFLKKSGIAWFTECRPWRPGYTSGSRAISDSSAGSTVHTKMGPSKVEDVVTTLYRVFHNC